MDTNAKNGVLDGYEVGEELIWNVCSLDVHEFAGNLILMVNGRFYGLSRDIAFQLAGGLQSRLQIGGA